MSCEIKEVWAPRLGVAVSIQPSPHLDPWDYDYVYIVNRYTFTDQVLDLSSYIVSRDHTSRKLRYVFESSLILECLNTELFSETNYGRALKFTNDQR